MKNSKQKKNIKISLRVETSLLGKLKILSKMNNASVSSLLEEILINHVELHENPVALPNEKRKSLRKKYVAPALLSLQEGGKYRFLNGNILDFSTDAFQIDVPSAREQDVQDREFQVLFFLSSNPTPFFPRCRSIRVYARATGCVLVAKMLDCGNAERKSIEQFLQTNELLHASSTNTEF